MKKQLVGIEYNLIWDDDEYSIDWDMGIGRTTVYRVMEVAA